MDKEIEMEDTDQNEGSQFEAMDEDEMSKPPCKLIGEDGNVFNIINLVKKALTKAGMPDKAKEFQAKAFASHSYDAVLQLAMEYVEVE